MKTEKRILIVSIVLGGLMLSCMLPGMIPLKSEPEGPMPYMEEDTDEVIRILSGDKWKRLQALAPEQYTEEDAAGPGTLTYTVTIADNTPTYFSYGWCTVDEAILQQNFEHIDVQLYINGDEFPANAIHNLTYTSNDLVCLDHGVLLSEWPEGSYKLEAVATFDEKINDGLADYEPGDYIFIYNVSVKKEKEGAFAPSSE
jgi:hypothetical protein